MADVEAIDIGATIKVGATVGRIINICIDEDGVPQLSINWMKIPYDSDPEKHVAYEDLRTLLENDEAERVNSLHEAWQWRIDNIEEV